MFWFNNFETEKGERMTGYSCYKGDNGNVSYLHQGPNPSQTPFPKRHTQPTVMNDTNWRSLRTSRSQLSNAQVHPHTDYAHLSLISQHDREYKKRLFKHTHTYIYIYYEAMLSILSLFLPSTFYCYLLY